MFETVGLFAVRCVYRQALDRSVAPGEYAEVLRLAEETADLLDALAIAARAAPTGIPITLPPFGEGDTETAPSRAAVAAARLRDRLAELRSARPAVQATARVLLDAASVA